MESKLTLKIYPMAQADFESIFRYISEELNSPVAAGDLIDAFYQALEKACEFPQMHPTVSNRYIKDRTLRKIVVKNYIVFYRAVFDKREIQVVRVLYGMMDYEKYL